MWYNTPPTASVTAHDVGDGGAMRSGFPGYDAPHLPFCHQEGPLPRCHAYFVFDVTAMARLAGTNAVQGGCLPCAPDLGGYIAWDIGRMVNRDSTHAHGASAQTGGADRGGLRFALQRRTRIWLAHGFIFDAAAGPLLAQQDGHIDGVQDKLGVTAESAVGIRNLVTVTRGGDVIRGIGHTASAVYVGGRASSWTGVLASLIVAAAAVATAAALSHGL